MKMLGKDAINQIDEETFNNSEEKIDFELSGLEPLFIDFTDSVKKDSKTLKRSAIEEKGSVENGGTVYSIETNLINLPLRYKNQLRKIVMPDLESEVNVYAIAENNNVSKSKLKIELITSLDNFLKNNEKYTSEMEVWFKERKKDIDFNEKNKTFEKEVEEKEKAKKPVKKKATSKKKTAKKKIVKKSSTTKKKTTKKATSK